MGDRVRFDLSDPDARWYCAACGAAFAARPERCSACGGASFLSREEAGRRVAEEAEEEERLAFLVAAASPADQERIGRVLDRAGIPWSCRDPAPEAFLAPPEVRAPAILVPAEHLERAREALAREADEPVETRAADEAWTGPAPEPEEVPEPAPGESLETLRRRRQLWLSRGLLAWVTLSMLVASLQLAFSEGTRLPGRLAFACGLGTLAGLVLDVFLPGRGAAFSLLSYLATLLVLLPVGIGNWMAFIGLLAAANCWRLSRKAVTGRGELLPG